MKSEPIQIRCHAQYHGRTVDLTCLSLRYHGKLHDNYRIIADVVDGEGSQATLPADAESCKGLWIMFVVYFAKTGQSLSFQGQMVTVSSRSYHSQRQRVLRIVAQSELSQFFTNRRTGIYYSPKLADVLNLGIRAEAEAAHCNQHTEFRFAIDESNDKRYPQHFQLTQYLEPDAEFWQRTLKRHGAWFNFYQPLNALPSLPKPIQLCVGDSNGAFNHTGLTAKLLELNDREGDGLYQLTAGFGPAITQIKAYYYDESSGQTLYATRQVRPGPVLTADIEVPFTNCTQAQVDTFADTLLECLQVQRLWIRSHFQGMALQAGDVLTIDVKSVGPAQPCVLTEVIYHFLPQQKPNAVRKPGEESLLDTDLNFAQEHSFVAHPLKANYRLPMLYKPEQTEPRYNGVMPGVFAETEGKDTVTPDSQGRIPLKFPYRYSHFCNGAKARYTRLALPLNSGEAGMSFPYYADTEFLISFANGSLDKPLIRGTAATGKTGHIHSPELQQRSAHVLPQGQQLLYTNTLGNTTAVKLGTNHQEGEHETFLMLNNLPSQTRPGDKHLDFIQATSASSEHQITGNLTEKLGGNKIKGNTEAELLHWITFGYFDQHQQPLTGMPYHITFDDGSTESGKLPSTGKVTLKELKVKQATSIRYGNLEEAEATLHSKREALQQQLNHILNQVKAQAAKDHAQLQQHSALWGEWQQGKAAAGGLFDSLWSQAKATVKTAIETYELVIQGPTESDIKSVADKLAQTKDTVEWLARDQATQAMLIQFAEQYYRDASPQQLARIRGEFIGYVLPTIIVALVSDGTGEIPLITASASDSAELAQTSQLLSDTAQAIEAEQKALTVYNKAVDAEHVEQFEPKAPIVSDEALITEAIHTQTRGGMYFADRYVATTLKQGERVYGGLPGQTEFYTSETSIERSELDSVKFFRGLQVAKHASRGYRRTIGVYEVQNTIRVPAGKALANPQFGEGGFDQYVISNYQHVLKLVDTIELEK